MKTNYLPIASIIISAIVILNEISFINKTSLAWVIIALAVANALNSIHTLMNKKKSKKQ